MTGIPQPGTEPPVLTQCGPRHLQLLLPVGCSGERPEEAERLLVMNDLLLFPNTVVKGGAEDHDDKNTPSFSKESPGTKHTHLSLICNY